MHLIFTLGFAHIRCVTWCPSKQVSWGRACCLFSIPDSTEQSSSICSGDSGQPSTRVGFASLRFLTASLHPAPCFLGRKPKGPADSHPMGGGPWAWIWAGGEWCRQPPRDGLSPTRKGDRESQPTQHPLLPLALPLRFLANYIQRKKNQSTPKVGEGNPAYFYQIFLFWDQKHRTSQIKLSESQMWTHFKWKTHPSSRAELSLRKPMIAVSDTRAFLPRAGPRRWREGNGADEGLACLPAPLGRSWAEFRLIRFGGHWKSARHLWILQKGG